MLDRSRSSAPPRITAPVSFAFWSLCVALEQAGNQPHGAYRTFHCGEIRRILLQKSFGGDERKFLEPLMRFTRSDVRDHIVSSKIDHGPP
jgi:hypothetical protein